jgi:hypothetical protein
LLDVIPDKVCDGAIITFFPIRALPTSIEPFGPKIKVNDPHNRVNNPVIFNRSLL